MNLILKKRGVIPGFPFSFGITVFYLSLMVLLPLSALVIKSASSGWDVMWAAAASPRAMAAFRLSFTASFAAATVNAVFGLVVAWVLVRYRFPGRKLADVLVDLPFALPTAVAGIALTTAYAPDGILGRALASFGIQAVYAPPGVVIAMTFVGLPFVVRTVQPVLEDLDKDVEEAAASLGADRFKTFGFVILPHLLPALASGFALAFARALGEYGSVAFISGNLPYKTEVVPLIIVNKLEQFDYAGATAVATVTLALSFALLLLVNSIQLNLSRRGSHGTEDL
jgi:sulfate transport system permease protein